MKEGRVDFLAMNTPIMDINGFWMEENKESIYRAIEAQYQTEIIRDWMAVNVSMNEDKVLVKWTKRFLPLSAEELKENYGR